MALSIPEDLLQVIFDNVPMTVRVDNGKKQGWEFLEGFSRASCRFRQLAFKRWFSTLRMHGENDWEYVLTLLWISQFVRELHCSGVAWAQCYTKRFDPTTSVRFSLKIKDDTSRALAAFSRLDAVFCDTCWVHSETGHIEAVLLDKFTQALPRGVGSLKLMHCPVLPVITSVSMIRNLPNLHVLDLGMCTVHCSCASCVQHTRDLHAMGNTYLRNERRFEFLKFAAQTPPHEHLQELAFNVHLTHPTLTMIHRMDHKLTLSLMECPRCPFEAARDTFDAESMAVMAFAKSLPALRTVQWCSWFGKNGRREFTIHRGDRSSTSGEITLEADS